MFYVIKNNKNQYFTRLKWNQEGWVDLIEQAEIIETGSTLEEMGDEVREVGSPDPQLGAYRVEVKVTEVGEGRRKAAAAGRQKDEQRVIDAAERVVTAHRTPSSDSVFIDEPQPEQQSDGDAWAPFHDEGEHKKGKRGRKE